MTQAILTTLIPRATTRRNIHMSMAAITTKKRTTTSMIMGMSTFIGIHITLIIQPIIATMRM